MLIITNATYKFLHLTQTTQQGGDQSTLQDLQAGQAWALLLLFTDMFALVQRDCGGKAGWWTANYLQPLILSQSEVNHMTFEEACRPGRPLFLLDVSHQRKLQMFFFPPSNSPWRASKGEVLSYFHTLVYVKLSPDLYIFLTSSWQCKIPCFFPVLVREYQRVKVQLKCNSAIVHVCTSDKSLFF